MDFILQLRNIDKSFYGVPVLRGVNFDLYKGEVHALLGENGAGKSTLIKIVSGAYQMDSGDIILDRKKIGPGYSPKIAEDLGVVTIYQNFHLIPHLSVAENVALRNLTSGSGLFIDWKGTNAQARAALAKINFAIDPRSRVKELSVAKKQMLEIAIALSKNARVIIMDEPTAALSRRETESLFDMILQLKAKGIGVIYVSHKLEEVKQIGDRVTILRDGKSVTTATLRDTAVKDLIGLMIGRELMMRQAQRNQTGDREVLSLRGISTLHLPGPLSLAAREHEILGITGLVGAGKTELARAIFGADELQAGSLHLNGKEVKVRSPRDAVKLGIGYLPEDRDGQGLCLSMGVKENLTLALFAKLKGIFFDRLSERALVRKLVSALRIRTASVSQPVKYLSGGNKQKVVLGKWLEANCKVLVLDEPTIGIDVGVREEIYDLVRRFIAQANRAVIFISSDMNEVLEIADRILVMSRSRLVADLNPKETSKQEIMEYSMGPSR
ncbi:MAG: sugar ABC transporter ATP-binding protein [Verrucomicrobia bacterium]|nr:sugar ABC transporter ATP-binding protein [Verrucomicrobiota bacterium]